MFDRPHHQRIARLLARIDAAVLDRHACWFGGGTAIALRYGEYRESIDVDFLVCDADAFRGLRRLILEEGLVGITRPGAPALERSTDLRSDADGIRTRVVQDGVEIKFEIVREGRIGFETPGINDKVCGLSSLTPVDLAASKLLAHVDRGLDDSTFNRDLIDLAMMRLPAADLRRAHAKAAAAYGDLALRDGVAAGLGRFRSRPGWLGHCLDTMAMTQPQALMWTYFRRLERNLPAASTTRDG